MSTFQKNSTDIITIKKRRKTKKNLHLGEAKNVFKGALLAVLWISEK